jgi:predicted KAP-like P-loop ATPase
MNLAVLAAWIALANQWQPLLASLLAVLAAIILSAGMIKAAKIRAARSTDIAAKSDRQDLRVSVAPASMAAGTLDSVNGSLEKLRSLLRSALSSLSSTDADEESARSLCARIAAFQWKEFALPVNEDKRLRESYASFLNQFELLQIVLGKEWSPSETSAILIQLNANARALSTILRQMETGESHACSHQNQH